MGTLTLVNVPHQQEAALWWRQAGEKGVGEQEVALGCFLRQEAAPGGTGRAAGAGRAAGRVGVARMLNWCCIASAKTARLTFAE